MHWLTLIIGGAAAIEQSGKSKLLNLTFCLWFSSLILSFFKSILISIIIDHYPVSPWTPWSPPRPLERKTYHSSAAWFCLDPNPLQDPQPSSETPSPLPDTNSPPKHLTTSQTLTILDPWCPAPFKIRHQIDRQLILLLGSLRWMDRQLIKVIKLPPRSPSDRQMNNSYKSYEVWGS